MVSPAVDALIADLSFGRGWGVRDRSLRTVAEETTHALSGLPERGLHISLPGFDKLFPSLNTAALSNFDPISSLPRCCPKTNDTVDKC